MQWYGAGKRSTCLNLILYFQCRNELLQVIKNSDPDVNNAEDKKLKDSKGGKKKEDNYRSKFFSSKVRFSWISMSSTRKILVDYY